MRNHAKTAWIMAETEPYSFEPVRDSSQSEEDDVRESQDERQRGCMRVLCELGRATRKRMLMLQGNQGSS